METKNDNKWDEPDFKRSFRGYNIEEVDGYIEYIQTDIEALQRENFELQRKLKEASRIINDYKSAESANRKLYSESKEKADKIVKDAKTRAAHVIMRTSRQCNRIVADMVSQVEEQKHIYDATKNEILRFRSELFGEYSAHIRKINAFVEAAGVFDADALSDEDMEGFLSMLKEDNTELENDGNFDISDEVSLEVENIKNAAEQTAERILADRERSQDEFGNIVDFESEEQPEYEDEVKTVEEDVPYSNGSAENNDTPNGDFFYFEQAEGANGKDGVNDRGVEQNFFVPEKEIEDDSRKSDIEESSFKKALAELEKAIGITENNLNISISNDANEAEFNGGEYEEEIDVWQEESCEPGFDGYGFNISSAAREDDEEFYHENDDEYVVTSSDDGIPTAASNASIELPYSDTTGGVKRWSIKKSMSITDEFDAIEADSDEYDG